MSNLAEVVAIALAVSEAINNFLLKFSVITGDFIF
jgi:hypothetical protein